jgi:stress-induced morphogen
MRQATKINIKDQIENKLREKLDVIFLNLKDESYLHANHNEEAKAGGTHFSLTISTPPLIAAITFNFFIFSLMHSLI